MMTDRELQKALRNLHLDDAQAQALSAQYSVLDDAAKHRIMAQCNEKLSLHTDAQKMNNIEVSNVQQLTRTQRFRPLLTAAACLLVVCGMGAAVMLHGRTPDVMPTPPATEIPTITETTESTAPETTSATEHMITQDPTNPTEQNETEASTEQIAEYSQYAELVMELTAQYEELLDIVTFGTAYDENDTITFSVFPSEESLSYVYENEGFDYNQEYQTMLDYYASVDYGRYCRNTDERFDTIDEIEDYARSIVSERLYDELFRNDFTDGLTAYSAGDSVSSDNITDFTMHDGTLYVHAYTRTQGNLFNHWTDTPITITDVTENTFIAEREWTDYAPEYLASLSEEELAMMEYHIYQYLFVKDAATGEWRIDQQIYK